MKKIIIRQKNCVYITKNAEGLYCDFCGGKGVLFESDWQHESDCSKSDMQICVDCVKQLYKLI